MAVLPVGGAHGVARCLRRFGPEGTGARLGGLCDQREAHIVRQALAAASLGTPGSHPEMERFGFFVCVEDLEDELIRAATPALVTELRLPLATLVAFVLRRRRRLTETARSPYCSTVLIFIPPSETKAFPEAGAPVELGSLVLPELAPARAAVLKALVRLARGRARTALDALGLSESQAGELAGNRALASAPAGMAADVYTGVLYDALDLPGLHGRGVATHHVLIFSALWGVLRPGDRIPHYRCSAGVKLPVVGAVSALWRKALRAPLAAHIGDRLVVDLRSGAYASLWTPGANAVTVRVLHERESDGVLKRSVVSHFNKATKGRIARALLESGQRPGTPGEFTELVRALGYTVEPGPERGPGNPVAVDVIVREL